MKRLRPGEDVVLTDGRRPLGGRRGARPPRARTGWSSRLGAVVEEPPETPRITVVQALPKGDRGELAVETMTETGVDAIVPWAASRCITQWKGERGAKALAKWRATAREAGKQSRRVRFPEVADAMTTKQVAALLAEAPTSPAVLHEDRGTTASRWPRPNCPAPGTIVLVVGPEGGVSPEELALFAEAGARAYRLGPQRAAHLHRRDGGRGAAAGPHRPLGLRRARPPGDDGSEYMSTVLITSERGGPAPWRESRRPTACSARSSRGTSRRPIVRETETTVAFRDINPQAPTHVLVIPKVHYPDAASLAAAEPRIAADVLREAGEVAADEKIDGTATGSSSTPAPAPARPSSTRTPTSWAAAASSGPPDSAPLSVRELVVLGTASQVPTRHRNHNGYLLRWDGEGILFDPGEGTQRQMLRAGVAAHDINRICVTHFHGDHSPGPGRGDPADQPRPGPAPRHRALPGERAALLRPAAVRHRLPRDRRG